MPILPANAAYGELQIHRSPARSLYETEAVIGIYGDDAGGILTAM